MTAFTGGGEGREQRIMLFDGTITIVIVRQISIQIKICLKGERTRGIVIVDEGLYEVDSPISS